MRTRGSPGRKVAHSNHGKIKSSADRGGTGSVLGPDSPRNAPSLTYWFGFRWSRHQGWRSWNLRAIAAPPSYEALMPSPGYVHIPPPPPRAGQGQDSRQHLAAQESEAQRGTGTCPRPHSKPGGGLGLRGVESVYHCQAPCQPPGRQVKKSPGPGGSKWQRRGARHRVRKAVPGRAGDVGR